MNNKLKNKKYRLMKKMVLYMMIAAMPVMGFAQDDTQNPNSELAAEKYAKRLDQHEASMGTTVQNTYTARDPRQEKIDDRKERRDERRDFKRQLRLERAQRPYVLDRRRNPWRSTYPYGF